MTAKKKFILGGILTGTIAAGLALATPTIGAWYNVVIATGTVNHDLHVFAQVPLPRTRPEWDWQHEHHEPAFRAALETDGDSNVVIQEIKFSPGGTTGWHDHPGILILTLAADSGPVDWYDSNCQKRVYKAGDSWTEGTTLHDVVNNSGLDAHFLVAYVVAKNMNKRTDQPAPECAAALGLN